MEEAVFSMMRRLGAGKDDILTMQGILAITYQSLGRLEEASQIQRDVYSGRMQLHGEKHASTHLAALNYTSSLVHLQRYQEVKSVLRKTMPVARRVLGENHEHTLRMRSIYTMALYLDPAATLDDLREAVATLEDTERIARRVLGGAHPLTVEIGSHWLEVRDVLSADEGDVGSLRAAMEAMAPGDA